MDLKKFTNEDCDSVLKELKANQEKTVDFEIIPREGSNYIFKISTRSQTFNFYVKPKQKIPKIERILEKLKDALPEFNKDLTPKFICCHFGLSFFEDLSIQRMQTDLDLYDLEQIEVVVDTLSELHAASVAYEHRTKRKINEEFDLKNGKNENVNTLCHGNLTSGNIMFYFHHGKVKECKLINFQEDKLYGSPLHDVLQLVISNTDEQFWIKNLDDLCRFYYETLKNNLEKYQLSIEDILPFQELKMTWDVLLPQVKVEVLNSKINDEVATKR